jgi:VIT1/CCC1 family predicted Fe2+/Mn2+ transporter
MPDIHHHYSNRSPLIRAAVMGANDGIISMSGFLIALSSSGAEKEHVVLGTLSGLVAGALSMGAGEYISVSSQLDSEKAYIERESDSLKKSPETEFEELVDAYEAKGLERDLAVEVVKQLSSKDPIVHHLHEELGLSQDSLSSPKVSSLISCTSFTVGGGIPSLLLLMGKMEQITWLVYPVATLSLLALGFFSSKLGGVKPLKGIIRVFVVGILVMIISHYVGTNVL